MNSEKDLKLDVLINNIGLPPQHRDNVVNYFSQLKSKGKNWLEIEKELKKAFGNEKLKVIKKHRSALSEQNKVAFENCLSGLLASGEQLKGVQKFNNEEFSQFIGGICLAIESTELSVNTNQMENKRIEVNNYFNNPNEGFKQKLKRGFVKSIEKLSGFMQEITGIDPANPLESLKKKFGGDDKQKDKSPISDSKAIDDFIPSPVACYGALFAFGVMGFGSFAAAFAPAAILIIAAIKVKGVISSDEGKEGTIHNPIKTINNDYTELGTKVITHANKLNNERNKSVSKSIG